MSERELLYMSDLAELIGGGFSTERVRRILISCGAATKIGGRWITTRARLRAHFPQLLDVMEEADD